MSHKIIIIVIVFTITFITLPSTVSLFAGQHSWYNLEQPGTGVPCIKCHADVYDELNQSAYHKIWGEPGKADDQDCFTCHQINESITFASGDLNQPGKEAHAAASINCGYCHFNSSVAAAMGTVVAGGFGKSDLAGDTGSSEAHVKFVEDAQLDDPVLGTDIMLKENEACITCHTAVAVRVNFTHAEKLNFRAEKQSNGIWTHPAFYASGSVNTTVWGNAMGTGGFLNNSTASKPWGDGTWP